jgi:hypothetical protein
MTPNIQPMLTMLSVEISASRSGERQHAFLVYADEVLTAVLAHPDQSVAEVFGTAWVLQAGFGPEAVWKQADWHALMIHRDGVQTESVV